MVIVVFHLVRLEMEALPNELLLEVFSFLLSQTVFRTISLVCKRFYSLPYDVSTIRRSGSLLKVINLRRKSYLVVRKIIDIISCCPTNFVEFFSLQECDTTWELLENAAGTFKYLNVLNLPGVDGVPIISKDVQPFVFPQLLELNICNTKVGNSLIDCISKCCKHLYSLNISRCPNITAGGLLKAEFNLMVLNIAHCNVGFPVVVHALRVYDRCSAFKEYR